MATVKLLALDPNYGVPTETANSDVGQLGQLSVLGIGGVGINANNTLVSNVASPISAGDATNKAYVDGIAQGIDAIQSVAVLASGNVALSGLQTIDGYVLTAGDRVLLIGQTNAVQNGIWIASGGAWARPTMAEDYTSGRKNVGGVFVFVETGSAWAATGFICLSKSATVDTDPTVWSQFTGAGEITAGPGLTKSTVTGNTLSVLLAPNSGMQFTAGALDHLLNPAGGLAKAAAGLAVTVNSNATLAVDASGLRTLGLPNLFTVAGLAVDANVTAPNLNTLVDGNASLADSLHSHQNVLESQAQVATHKNGSVALVAGDPVQWSGTADTLARCDSAAIAKAQVLGVAAAAAAANGNVRVIKRGVAYGVLSQATPGQPVYLGPGGGLSTTLNTNFLGNLVRVGWAKNATDLDVAVQYMGQRGAN